LLTLLTIAILSGIYAYLRDWRAKRIRRELERPLVMTDSEKTRFSGFMEKWGLVAGVAGITVCDAVYSVSLIDENVLAALDFSSVADLSTFSDISQYMDAHFAAGAGLVGSLARLQGYTAEQVAAAHLASQGHVVEFPDAANQPGYDLLVDGHPFQVKDTLSPGLINEHLANYPDIPVIVNTEMGVRFADNPNVIVDPDLSHEQIAVAVDQTIEGVSLLDTAHVHIPLITLALSCLKEGSLLLAGKTDVKTAGSHVLYDTASVGLGGAAGAKIGVLAGSPLGPAGAGIGLVLGGVIGAITGRVLAGKIKHSRLKEKQAAYNSAVIDVGQVMPAVIDNKKQLVAEKMERAVKAVKVPWWRHIWPSREEYLAEGLKGRYRQTLDRLNELKNRMQSLSPCQAGEEACKIVAEGGFYDPALTEALARVREAQEELLKEMRRLGLA